MSVGERLGASGARLGPSECVWQRLRTFGSVDELVGASGNVGARPEEFRPQGSKREYCPLKGKGFKFIRNRGFRV